MKWQFTLIVFLLSSLHLQSQTSLTIHLTSSGTLQNEFINNSYDPTAVINLTLTGVLDARDFRYMRDDLTSLAMLDLSVSSIVSYTGPNGPVVGASNKFYPANELPYCAFFDSQTTHTGKPTLTSIVLPNTLKNIGDYSLQYCKALSLVTIPNSVDSIKPFAFKYDTALVNISIPAGVDIIMQGAFQQAGGVVVDAGNPYYSSLDGVLFNKNKSVLICCPYTKHTYTIPSSVDTLGFESFYGCRNLSSVVIPTTVEYISTGTFESSGLLSVDIPNSINRISDNTFLLCTKLTQVNLPNTITYIGFASFYACTALTSIDIPSSVDTIQAICFYADSALVSVILHQGLKYLGFAAFQGCSHLPSINIPTSLTSLPPNLFFYCKSLSSITIPSSITTIGSSAFSKCYSLSSIYAESSIPTDLSSSPGVFFEVDTNTCILYVPIGSISQYELANQWKDFTIMQEYPFGTNNVTTESVKVFVENGILNIWEIPNGEDISVFNLQGIEIFHQEYSSDKLSIKLPSKGIFIILVGNKTCKISST